MTTRSTPERLDAAVESLLAGDRPLVEPELRPLVDTAALVADALRPVPAGAGFELRLAARLAQEGLVRRAADAVSTFTRRELAHPGRLIAAGAVSSAAVGVTVTAYAMWRSSRRHAVQPQRLVGR